MSTAVPTPNDLDAPPQHLVTDDLDALIEALPPRIRDQFDGSESRQELLEVVLDLGRLPEARYLGREVMLSHEEVTLEDLEFVIERIGDFGLDNRAGIERTLHRFSCIRNRRGKIVGLTCRVGRAVYGTIRVIEDLVRTGKSILLLGRPGVGKTTMLREVARVLADDANRRVVIVDTSNEIGGDGDIPHPAIGGARRMQVPSPAEQHAVMIEAVENHMPEVIVIDEIGTELEAAAARTIAERGVQLVGTAHGTTLENLMMNPTLSDLVGGIQSVTLGDDEARRRGTQKSILERKAPPTFDIVVEIQNWERVAIHADVATTVDSLLRGAPVRPEVRQLAADGSVESGPELQETAGIAEAWDASQHPSRRRNGSAAAAANGGRGGTETPGVAVRILPFGLSRSRLEQAVRATGVNVELVDDVRDADALMTLRPHYRNRSGAIREAEDRALPIYVLKTNTAYQMEQALLQFRAAELDGRPSVRTDPLTEAFRTTEEAIARVIDEGMPVELPAANSYIRRVQHQIAGRYNLQSRSSGREPNRRVKILPAGHVGGPTIRR
ncbi:MAG: R3H domain-containing nucleic acid-binding protein [Dehalococcoidia bacterium]